MTRTKEHELEKYTFKTTWFKDLPEEDIESFKKELINSKKVLDKLAKIVYNINKNDGEIRLADYDSPSWGHKQAHLNGRNDALNEILRLITLDKTSTIPIK